MIRPVLEDNNTWVRLHLYTEGRCGREITEKPEWDVWIDMSLEELKELRNACDYKINYDFKQDTEFKEKDTEC